MGYKNHVKIANVNKRVTLFSIGISCSKFTLFYILKLFRSHYGPCYKNDQYFKELVNFKLKIIVVCYLADDFILDIFVLLKEFVYFFLWKMTHSSALFYSFTTE